MTPVDPNRPGHRWWMYQRPAAPDRDTTTTGDVPGATATTFLDGRDDGPAAGESSPPPSGRAQPSSASRSHPSAVTHRPVASPMFPLLLGVVALVAVVLTSGSDLGWVRPVLVAVVGLALARGVGNWLVRSHPSEPWIGWMLLGGVAVKLAASSARYWTLVHSYEGVGDATMYDRYGKLFADAWRTGAAAPELSDLRQTNFIRWFTGAVYYVAGSDMLTGYLVFGLLALAGSYLWYRATVDAVPFVDKRLYLALVLFVPSIAFWPSAIGKESLMQLGIGAMALGTSLLIRNALARGMLVALAGGWVLWVVRPHLLAMVALAGGVAYLLGRVRSHGGGGRLLARPVGVIVVAILVIFTITEGAAFLGIEELSLSSIEAELDEQTERSAQGGSEFENEGASLNPIDLPRSAVTVLLRPFPWEVDFGVQLLASFESALLAVALVWRLPSLRAALRRSLSHSFLLYCWVLTALYAVAFSSFANFGLLVRQRSLVLPALFVLLAVNARRARSGPDHDPVDGAETGVSPRPGAARVR